MIIHLHFDRLLQVSTQEQTGHTALHSANNEQLHDIKHTNIASSTCDVHVIFLK